MRLLAILLGATLATPALACDKVIVHGLSYHTDRDFIPNVNEFNYGIGCRFENVFGSGFDAQSGVFKNSFGNPSFYGLIDATFDNGLGVFVGTASGYPDQPLEIAEDVTFIGGLVWQSEYVTYRATPSYDVNTEEVGVVVSASFNF